MAVNNDNVAATQEAMETSRTVGLFLPAVYIVETTNACNVHCIMCPTHRIPVSSKGHMNEATFTHIINTIAPFAELTMLYFMGEPTLHPEFPVFLAIARAGLRGRIVVSTNGTLLNDINVRALLSNSDIIIVCIDRWNKLAYERIRHGSNFENVILGTERLLQERGSSSAPIVVVKLLDIALKNDSLRDMDAEQESFVAHWDARGALPVAGWLNTWAGQLPLLDRLRRRDTPYVMTKRTPCADLWFKMVVNWRGEVVLCCHDWSYSTAIGNLLQLNLEEIWHSDSMKEIRQRHIDHEFGAPTICSNCAEWAFPDELDCYIRLNHNDIYRVF